MTEVLPHIDGVPGFKVAGVHAGLKDDVALDFALIVSDSPCTAAAVFTTNQVKSAHVLVDMERLEKKRTGYRAVAVNTKCANACTGQQGIDNAHQTARWVAEKLGCAEDEVLVMSTGVIGTQLPMDKIKRGIELAADKLETGRDAWQRTAEAIMTTDTRPKLASLKQDDQFTVAGPAKGAGMIAPNMATMLGIVVTDAALGEADILPTLQKACDKSFNCISVDGDTSTNDTVLLLSTGKATGGEIAQPLTDVCRKLAQGVVRDGEGATKFITIQVFGAESDAFAKAIANTIATSPLVKTAFYGGDANWGRIMMAAGRSGVTLDPKQMKLWMAGGESERRELLLFADGLPTDYSEERATAIVHEQSIYVTLDCGQGKGHAVVWTCDLSHDYVSINGHYRS
ncbi:MAG: bifunctional glutamate N-acetyltransferase/amino-acid acetyltransferase ArgJ [Anaerolineae bacterium]|nr:bifunctional glutamate N-acetyltransferase/amino-acid acetyltransferase ArgJ [Anaerolineae bacterium]